MCVVLAAERGVAEGSRCNKTAWKHIEDKCPSLQSTWSSVCSAGDIVFVVSV